jgi:hypothetical protein
MTSLAGRLAVAAREKAGLRPLSAKLMNETLHGSIEQYGDASSEAVKACIARLFSSLDEAGRVDFHALFQISTATPTERATNIPISVENDESEVFVDPFGYGLSAEEYRALCGGSEPLRSTKETGRPSSSSSHEHSSTEREPYERREPVFNLEIGSGDGEWIVAQAAASALTLTPPLGTSPAAVCS